MTGLWATALGLVAAVSAPVVVRLFPRHAGRILALWPLAIFGLLLSAAPAALTLPGPGAGVGASFDWVPSLGIRLSLRIDGLGLLMGLLIEGLCALIVLYAGRYMAGKPYVGRFFAWLFVFKSSMLGLVLAQDLILFFVFWELTSISSFMLIGFEAHKPQARRSALQALLVTVGGGQALLAGLILLAVAGGSSDLAELAERADLVKAHALYLPIVLLVLAGAVTKSAQVPFHFWLPNAMAAPTPVSAFLHSATLVKAGVLLLMRMTPVLGATDVWGQLLMGFGGATLVSAAWLGLGQTDLKRVLAYATVAALGALVFLLGIGGPSALHAAVAFLTAHAFYKGGLFLVAGTVDHETGTREVTALTGLRSKMTLTAAAGMAHGASMLGLIPLFGFLGKEALYEAAVERGAVAIAVGVLGFSALGAASLVAGVRPFLGAPSDAAKGAHEAPWDMLVGPLLLAVLGVTFGVVPALLNPLISAAAGSIGGPETYARSLSLWHGPTPALAFGALSLTLAAALFHWRTRVREWLTRGVPPSLQLDHLYDLGLVLLDKVARGQTALLQTGRLRSYVAVTLAALVALCAFALWAHGSSPVWPGWTSVRPWEPVALVLAAVGALTAALTGSLLTAVVALGAVGVAESLIYVFFGAPDLAITQIVVQILSLILIAMVLSRRDDVLRDLGVGRPLAALLASFAGGLMTVLALIALDAPPARQVGDEIAMISRPEGHGRNVVNTILVDFRALDTLGEVTVLVVAGLGVYGLMRIRAVKEPRA